MTPSLEQYTAAAGPAALIAAIAVSLVECFLGYIIYRLALAVLGFCVGAAAGEILLRYFVAVPSGADFLVVCMSVGLLVAIGSWFLYRLMFSLLILAGGGMGIAAGMAHCGEGWVAAVVGFTTLILAVLGFIYLKWIFILISSLAGGVSAAWTAARMIVGPETMNLQSPTPHTVALSVTLGAGLLLAAAGAYVQAQLAGVLHTPLTPDPRVASRAGGGRRSRR